MNRVDQKRKQNFEIVPGKNDRNEHVFSVIVKRTYNFTDGGVARRSELDQPLRKTDYYYENGDPQWSVVQYESEIVPFKAFTDVVVIGKAYAPGGKATQEMIVSLEIGKTKKSLAITGDRECHYRDNKDPLISEPQFFTEMEIRYDLAYGGQDTQSVTDIPFSYPRNSMGKGVALRNVKQVIDGLALPNIEEPEDRIVAERVVIGDPKHWPSQPLPGGIGWRQRNWYPRSALLGSYPAFLDVGIVTQEEAWGLLPENHVALAKQMRLSPYEAYFNNGASLGLMFPDLDAGERISLNGLTPQGSTQFLLPQETPAIGLDLGRGMCALETRLHTLCIRPDDGQIDMIWRGSQVFPGYHWLANVTCLQAEVV